MLSTLLTAGRCNPSRAPQSGCLRAPYPHRKLLQAESSLRTVRSNPQIIYRQRRSMSSTRGALHATVGDRCGSAGASPPEAATVAAAGRLVQPFHQSFVMEQNSRGLSEPFSRRCRAGWPLFAAPVKPLPSLGDLGVHPHCRHRTGTSMKKIFARFRSRHDTSQATPVPSAIGRPQGTAIVSDGKANADGADISVPSNQALPTHL